MKPRPPSIRIFLRTGVRLPQPARFKAHLTQVLQILGISRGQWAISLVRDRAMVPLHEQTMQLPTTTDVLTFNLSDSTSSNPRSARFLLDLDTVICVDEAKRQATARGHAVEKEILLYAIHSLLHVCGHDDLTPSDATRMHRREDVILRALKVGPVYLSTVVKPASGVAPGKPKRRTEVSSRLDAGGSPALRKAY